MADLAAVAEGAVETVRNLTHTDDDRHDAHPGGGGLREGPEAYVQFVRRLKTVYGYTYSDFAPEYRGAPVVASAAPSELRKPVCLIRARSASHGSSPSGVTPQASKFGRCNDTGCYLFVAGARGIVSLLNAYFSEMVEIVSQRLVADKHLQLKLKHQGEPVDGIWFGRTGGD